MKTETKTEAYDYAFPAGFPQSGLTKREYFAAMAMQGLIAANDQCGSIENKAVRMADDLIVMLNVPYSELYTATTEP